MSHSDMVTTLLSYIQNDANLIVLIRTSVTAQLMASTTDSDDRLTALVKALGLYTGQ